MPVDVEIGGEKMRIQPKTAWSELKVKHQGEVKVDPDYYVGLVRMR
jgi:hypothetical protein